MTANDMLAEIEPSVRVYAARLAKTVPPSVADFDDFYQVGMGEAWRLVTGDGFDPSRGLKVNTWAWKRVLGGMLDYRRRLCPLSRRHLREIVAAGCEPPVHHSLSANYRQDRYHSGHNTHRVLDPVDDGPAPFEGVDLAEDRLLDGMKLLTQVLTPNERAMVADYLVRGRLLREIAQARGVCESRACQMWRAILGKLRQRAAELGGFAAVAALAT